MYIRTLVESCNLWKLVPIGTIMKLAIEKDYDMAIEKEWAEKIEPVSVPLHGTQDMINLPHELFNMTGWKIGDPLLIFVKHVDKDRKVLEIIRDGDNL